MHCLCLTLEILLQVMADMRIKEWCNFLHMYEIFHTEINKYQFTQFMK